MGKFLIICGIILVAIGLIFQFYPKLPFFGKLPGDFTVERGNFKLYFPLATSLVVSVILSIILLLLSKLKQ